MKFMIPFIILFTISTFSYSQDHVQKILQSYFRTHPFEMRFSSFLTTLQKDPLFTVENIQRRTDSSFFYLTGSYKNFNPFRFTPKEVKLVVAEDQLVHADSLKTLDTIINLQMMGIIDSSSTQGEDVQKEFKRFHRNFSAQFWKTAYEKIQDGPLYIGEINNYFDLLFSVSPVTIAWGFLAESHQYTFCITIRFKVKENQAVRILSPDGL